MVYPQTKTIAVHRHGDVVSMVRGDDAELSGEGVIPGLTIRLGDIFGSAEIGASTDVSGPAQLTPSWS